MAATEAGLMTGMASKLTVLVPELKYMYMYLHKEFAKNLVNIEQGGLDVDNYFTVNFYDGW